MKKYLLPTLALIFSALSSIAQTTIYSQTFGTGLGGWTSVDNNGTAGKWIHGTNPFNSADTQYYGPQTNGSPTAANGFALILSNLNTSALNTDLISPAINCTGQTYVALQFYEFMAIASSASAQVFVSVDNTNWSLVYDAASQTTAANPQLVQIDISAYASNQPTVYIKFNYQATNDAWWTVDDISVLSLPDNDAAVLSVNAPSYMGISNFPVSATIENFGGTNLNSVTLDYTVNGAGDVSQTFTGLGLPPFGTTTVTFTTSAPLVTVQADTLSVIASAPNGGTDGNALNDAANTVVTTLSHVPVKNVLVEEFSTAVCGYCPGGATRVGEILAADGSYAVPVTLHAGFYTDGMTTSEATAIAGAFTNAAPTACIDRILYPKQPQVAIGVSGMGTTTNEWRDAVEARKPITPPVSIAGYSTYDAGTRVLNVTVNATFYGPVSDHFRMNCYVVEDSVVGSGANYDQHSYYHDSPTTLNPWLNVGTSLISQGTWGIAGYVHNHVDRKLLDGSWGVAGVIPATTTDGGTYTKSYSYTIPNTINVAHATLVAFVYQYNANYTSGKNEVQNVISFPIGGSDSIAAPVATVVNGIKETPNALAQISLYPNPATDVVHVNYTMNSTSKLSFQVYNSIGQLVSNISEATYNQGDYQTLINTSKYQSGLYFVTIKNEGKVMQTLKFVVSR